MEIVYVKIVSSCDCTCLSCTDYFHYRNIDVSTLKELYKRWMPKNNQFIKLGNHRALDDIKESIAELNFYRQNFLIAIKR